jgi:hypothetical protein
MKGRRKEFGMLLVHIVAGGCFLRLFFIPSINQDLKFI